MKNTQITRNTHNSIFYRVAETDKYYLQDIHYGTVEVPYRIDRNGVHCFELPENTEGRKWLKVTEYERGKDEHGVYILHARQHHEKTDAEIDAEIAKLLAMKAARKNVTVTTDYTVEDADTLPVRK